MDREQSAPMNKEQVSHALDYAFMQHVHKLFGDRIAAGEADAAAKARFEDGVRHAQRIHNDAQMAFSETPNIDKSAETDDEFRTRMLPIAGDDSWRSRIAVASGSALDALGEHYNLKREMVLPADREIPMPVSGEATEAIDGAEAEANTQNGGAEQTI